MSEFCIYWQSRYLAHLAPASLWDPANNLVREDPHAKKWTGKGMMMCKRFVKNEVFELGAF